MIVLQRRVTIVVGAWMALMRTPVRALQGSVGTTAMSILMSALAVTSVPTVAPVLIM
jgi:hypothetical protein